MNPSLETNLTVGAGTEGYMAPEQKTLLYDRPADVYSFGVIIARILGVKRWKDATSLRIDDFDESCADPVLVQLCLKCVQASPLHRPSFEQIHQVLLCEFIRRAVARTIINCERREESENVPLKQMRQHNKAASNTNKGTVIHLDSPSDIDSTGQEDENAISRKNPPRSGRAKARPVPKKATRKK
jgi:serine/threonine protein kinase